MSILSKLFLGCTGMGLFVTVLLIISGIVNPARDDPDEDKEQLEALRKYAEEKEKKKAAKQERRNNKRR